MTNNIDFSPILNNRFSIQHLVIRAGYDTPPHFICPKNLRPWSRFFYLQSGEVEFETSDGRKILVSAGEILYLPHNVSYVSHWTKSDCGWYYSIEFILNSKANSIITFSDNIQIVSKTNFETYKQTVQEMHHIWNNGAPGHWMRCCELFLSFLQLLTERNESVNLDNSLASIRKGIDYLENNYTKNITTKQLSDLCNMSESNFRRLFRNYSELSPISYRNWLRMKHAKELLKTGLYSVSEVAAIVNISDPFYFNKMFKHYFNTAPSNIYHKNSENI